MVTLVIIGVAIAALYAVVLGACYMAARGDGRYDRPDPEEDRMS